MKPRHHRMSPILGLALLTLTVTGCGEGNAIPTTDSPGPQAPENAPMTETSIAAVEPGGDQVPAAGGTAATTTTAPAVSPATAAPDPGATSTTSATVATTADPATTAPSTTAPPVPTGPFVRIGKDFYPFTPDDCLIFDETDVIINGVGEAPDGSPSWVSFDASTDSRIWAMRIDIGADDPFQDMEDHWVAGFGAADDMEVIVDDTVVTATGTFVSGLGYDDTEGEFFAECG